MRELTLSAMTCVKQGGHRPMRQKWEIHVLNNATRVDVRWLYQNINLSIIRLKNLMDTKFNQLTKFKLFQLQITFVKRYILVPRLGGEKCLMTSNNLPKITMESLFIFSECLLDILINRSYTFRLKRRTNSCFLRNLYRST